MDGQNSLGVLADEGFSPYFIRALLGEMLGKQVSKHLLSHVVRTTIGESETPADGRGSKRLFSLCDAVCIVMGASLSDLGLPPGRVRSCIDAIVGAWNRIVEDIRLDPETLERADDWDFHHDWFLVAEDIPANGQLRFAVFEQDPWGHGRSGFVPRIVNGRDVYFRPTIGYPRPMIMLNVSQTVTLVLQHVFGLARELRSAGERF